MDIGCGMVRAADEVPTAWGLYFVCRGLCGNSGDRMDSCVCSFCGVSCTSGVFATVVAAQDAVCMLVVQMVMSCWIVLLSITN